MTELKSDHEKTVISLTFFSAMFPNSSRPSINLFRQSIICFLFTIIVCVLFLSLKMIRSELIMNTDQQRAALILGEEHEIRRLTPRQRFLRVNVTENYTKGDTYMLQLRFDFSTFGSDQF